MPFRRQSQPASACGQRTGVEQTVEVGAKHIALHAAFPASVGVVGEGFALSLGHAGVYLIAFQLCTRKWGRRQRSL